MPHSRGPEEGSDGPNYPFKRRHFFKIIDDSIIQDQQLRIPREFVRKLGKELSNVAVLKVPSGKIWNVGLKKADGKVWFQNGWQDFVEYHSIREKHLLVFRYDGNSRFYVCIFDSTASEIEYPCDNETYEENILDSGWQVKEENQGDDSVEIIGVCPSSQEFDKLEDQQTSKRRENPLFLRLRSSMMKRTEAIEGTQHPGNLRAMIPSIGRIDANELSNVVESYRSLQSHFLQKSGRKEFSVSQAHRAEPARCGFLVKQRENKSMPVTERRPRTKVRRFKQPKGPLIIEDRKRMLQAAKAFKSKNPFFTVIMRPSYVSYGFILNIPLKFATRHLTENTQSVTLGALDGRVWPARYSFGRGGSGKISSGWDVFARENNLEEGDLCIFELVKKRPIELKVFIFRLVEDEEDL